MRLQMKLGASRWDPGGRSCRGEGSSHSSHGDAGDGEGVEAMEEKGKERGIMCGSLEIIGKGCIPPVAWQKSDDQPGRSRVWLRHEHRQVVETRRVSQMYFSSLISHVGFKLSCVSVCLRRLTLAFWSSSDQFCST